jgi:transmembrane sensor
MTESSAQTVEERAAAWDARLRSPDASDADRSAFRAWLHADPAHAEAFDQLQAALAALRDHAAHPELSALRDQGSLAARRAMARRARRRLAAGLVAAGLCGLAVAAALQPWRQATDLRGSASDRIAAMTAPAGAKLYQTALNERSTVSLQDGSSVTLDSGTRLAARFLPGRREIMLLDGQALFHVAKDPSRPFVVRAGDRTVTALGTVFDVRLDKGRVRVTLLEGRVAVRPIAAGTGGRVAVLQPRQELVEVSQGMPVVRAVDVDKAVSWTEGRLYLEDEPLSQAVEEMNRYAQNRIVLTDPALGALRVNGMFRTDNQTGFVAALQATLPIDARTDDQGRVLLQRRGA